MKEKLCGETSIIEKNIAYARARPRKWSNASLSHVSYRWNIAFWLRCSLCRVSRHLQEQIVNLRINNACILKFEQCSGTRVRVPMSGVPFKRIFLRPYLLSPRIFAKIRQSISLLFFHTSVQLLSERISYAIYDKKNRQERGPKKKSKKKRGKTYYTRIIRVSLLKKI